MLLVAATLLALAWANGPWAASYEAVWHAQLGVGVDDQVVSASVHFIVNDLLMTVFFFAAGLEIRRELSTGELCDRRRAALPVIAAAGGMVAPALIYLSINRGPLAVGWGIPTVTDIAFAVGTLALLGRRVPPSMRAFLLALAIIDDIGGILVIAIFYSAGVQLDGLLVAVAGIAAIIGLQRLGASRPFTYAAPAAAIWFGLYRAGVHPTVAGVLLGFLTPARPWPSTNASPAEELERWVHPWVSFAIMPLFALANAGVKINTEGLLANPTLVLGIAAGLMVGKPVGIVAASAVAVRLRVGSLPVGLTWRGLALVGIVAGIGFTMALFIADLALPSELADVAKLVALISSTGAALLALTLGRLLLAPGEREQVVRQPRRWFIPALERGPLAFVLLVFGAICAAIEVTATDWIAARAALFILVTLAGIVGVLRHKRTA